MQTHSQSLSKAAYYVLCHLLLTVPHQGFWGLRLDRVIGPIPVLFPPIVPYPTPEKLKLHMLITVAEILQYFGLI